MPTSTNDWGLKIPTGIEAPDGPGAFAAFATSVEAALGKRRAVRQNNGGSATSTTGIDINPDTTISDPSGMASGAGFIAPWTGLYRIGCRAGVNGGDIPNTNIVTIDCLDSGSGTVYGQVGQYGIAADVPMQYFDELVFTAGALFRFRLKWGGGANRALSYGTNTTRARIFSQYLGPA